MSSCLIASISASEMRIFVLPTNILLSKHHTFAIAYENNMDKNKRVVLTLLSLSARLLILALPLVMTGCATVPSASKETRDSAISFRPPPGLADVYVFRPSGFVGGGVLWTVGLDRVLVGQVGNNSFLCLPIVPGKHIIFESISSSGTSFTAEAGKNYYFIIHSPLTNTLKPITEDVAKAYAEEFTLSSFCGPEWAAKYAATQGGHASNVGANGVPVILYNPAAAAYNQQQLYDIMLMKSGRIP